MNLKSNQKGFTIVELLIVIVVIAILAAISVVAYVGIQNNARASERQSDASNIAKVAEVYFSNSSSYPTTPTQFGAATNATLPANVAVNVVSTPPPSTGAGAIVEANGPAKSGDTKTYIVQNCSASLGGKVHYFDPRTGQGAKSVTYGRGC